MLPSDGQLPQIPDSGGIANSAINFATKPLPMFTLWGMEIYPTYWQAITIVFLIFLLLLVIARMRYLYVHWNLGKSSWAMLFWGVALTIIVEAFLWIGGKTLLTTILGWNNAPKPIAATLDTGRERLVEVLGDEVEVKNVTAESPPTYQSVVFDYKELPDSDKKTVQKFVCEP